MRIALAQMSMVEDFDKNFKKTLQFMDLADEHKADLLVFPQLNITPYFPQYKKGDVGGVLEHVPDEFAISLGDNKIRAIAQRCKEYGFFTSPNLYIRDSKTNNRYNMSLWISPRGKIEGKSKLVHVVNRSFFYESDYFRPSEEGFRVFDSKIGKVGIVVSFDRHFPQSISTCALKGAQIILIPAANVDTEPLEMFETELRAAAFDNGVFIAMCNRVGKEGNMYFAGRSLVIDPDGNVIVRADDSQQFLICNIDLKDIDAVKKKRNYGKYRRPEMYI